MIDDERETSPTKQARRYTSPIWWAIATLVVSGAIEGINAWLGRSLDCTLESCARFSDVVFFVPLLLALCVGLAWRRVAAPGSGWLCLLFGTAAAVPTSIELGIGVGLQGPWHPGDAVIGAVIGFAFFGGLCVAVAFVGYFVGGWRIRKS